MKGYFKHLVSAVVCVALLVTSLSLALAETDPLNNPSEEFIIECLESIPEVAAIGAATKNNDPNRMLNTAGGYTAAVFFSTSLLNENAGAMTAEEVIAKGTDGGGCLEVYRTVEDANYRCNSLKIYSSKKVMGTVVIRLSWYLSEEDSQLLMEKIGNALNEKAYGDEEHQPAAEVPELTVSEALRNMQKYLNNKYYMPYLGNWLKTGGALDANIDIVVKPTNAVTFPAENGDGHYVFEYYLSGEEIHITRVTFVCAFDDMTEAGSTLITVAKTLKVLPSDNDEAIDRFLQILNLGQSYVNGKINVNVIWSDVNGRPMVCAVFDGLDV